MSISPVVFLPPLEAMPDSTSLESNRSVSVTKINFEQILADKLSQANQSLTNADKAMQSMALGETKNLHSVMMAAEEAKLQLQFIEQIRNKLLESYQQIMKEQI